MRLITWNCKGAFRRKHEAISVFHPDILVVPECEQLLEIPQALGEAPISGFKWFGSNPNKGIGILSYGDFSLDIHPDYDPRYQWIIPLQVSGPCSFLLFAVWTLPHKDSKSYVQPLMEAFHQYETLLKDSRVIWAGDFNAGVNFDRPSWVFKFGNFLDHLGQRGFRSLYHEAINAQHGQESDKTYFHHHHAESGFHIDYILANGGFQTGTFKLNVGGHGDWSRHSDHMPLICDFNVRNAGL